MFFILFIFYYILGFIGFLFLHIFRGSNQITLEPTKFQFVNQFFWINLFYNFSFCVCCYEDDDENDI